MKKKKFLTLILSASLLAGGVFSGAALAEEEQISERPEYDVRECVDLGGYVQLRIQVAPVNVTEEEVLQAADEIILDSDAMLPAANVQEGDEVNITYTGYLDGEEFEGGSEEGHMLVIGSGDFIEGFEEGLIGVGVGNTVDLSLTFPEDYYLENLAGREVVFTVTVNEILREPELTDEVAAEVTDGTYSDTDSWLASLRTDLEENAQEERQEEIREALVEALAENSEIRECPEELVEYLAEKEKTFFERLAELYPPVTYDELIASFGYTEDSFSELLRERAQEKAERELLLMAVADYESMSLSDEEFQDGVEEYMLNFGYEGTEEEFEAAYADLYGDQQLGIDLLMDKVLNYMEENAWITETETENSEENAES